MVSVKDNTPRARQVRALAHRAATPDRHAKFPVLALIHALERGPLDHVKVRAAPTNPLVQEPRPQSRPQTGRPALRRALLRVLLQEDINFLVTNRIPRRAATLFIGWFSRIEVGWVSALSIATWRLFADDLNLEEAKSTRFKTLHDCFIRELRDGARPIDRDPAHIVSPCDGVVGAFGRLRGVDLIQAKGFPYTLTDLLGDPARTVRYRDGTFITLRLKSNMYHRFHAPCDGRIRAVHYISGDTWNVNPITLRRIERLFCKNERAIIEIEPPYPAETIALVAVAAILVASIRLHCLTETLDLRRRGRSDIPCDATVARGQELGYFEAGSTILVFAPAGYLPHPALVEGATIRVGQPLMRRPAIPQPPTRSHG